MRFTAAITHEDSWYVARCLEVEVASQGKTVEEAQANLKEALELYFEDQPLPTEIERERLRAGLVVAPATPGRPPERVRRCRT